MELQIFVVLYVALFGKYTDAALGSWSQPGVSAADGSLTYSGTVSEDTASGTTLFTAVAAGTTVGYTAGTQTPSGKLAVAPGGAVTISTALNMEEHQTIILQIIATDSADSSSGTLEVTINIGDVNDNTPAFTSSTYLANIRDGACTATSVGTYVATDADQTAANNVITYGIKTGNDAGIFAMGTSTGLLTVATNMKIDHSDTSMHTLVIKATDSGSTALIGSATLTIYVCSAPAISVSIVTLFVALLASLR